jgi:hypothetical protein
MTSLNHCHPSDEAASRRKVLFAGLFAASALAPFPNTTMQPTHKTRSGWLAGQVGDSKGELHHVEGRH